MYKHCLCIILAFSLLLTGTAFAAALTDAPGTPTQDIVLKLAAQWLDEKNTKYDMSVMQADQLTMDTVTDAYQFVYEQKNRPIKYFSDEVQAIIKQMIGDTNPDALYMTEFMRLHAGEAPEPEYDVKMTMNVNIKYQVGQLIVVTLGDLTNAIDANDPTKFDIKKIDWIPVRSQVTAEGEITCTIPKDVIAKIQGEDLLFNVMTVRSGNHSGGAIITPESTTIAHATATTTDNPYQYNPIRPSRSADDIVDIGTITDLDGNIVDKNGNLVDKDGNIIIEHFSFQLVPQKETEVIKDELQKMIEFVDTPVNADTPQQPVAKYFPDDNQNELQLLINEVATSDKQLDISKLVEYEYVPLITDGYRDTDGDAIAYFTFATKYQPGQTIVTLLGLPKVGATQSDPTLMDWAVQRAKVNDNGEVEIVFDQLALIRMSKDTGLLIVLSEPLPVDENK